MDIDQRAHRLYHGDNWSGGLDVFDISTREPKYLQTIRMRGMLYGVSVARNVNKVFVGLSMSLVAVVDIDPASPTFHTVIAQVDTGGRGASASWVAYDETNDVVHAAAIADGKPAPLSFPWPAV